LKLLLVGQQKKMMKLN